MNPLLRIAIGGLAAWLGAVGIGRAGVASSASYALERYAFTAGKPNATGRVASASYVLEAGSLGGISYGAVTSATRRIYSGYLIPESATLARPNVVSLSVYNGRVWLQWANMGAGAVYTVESAPQVGGFSPTVTGLTTNTWDAALPVATSRCYRVTAAPP
jgi:hypothetical protein